MDSIGISLGKLKKAVSLCLLWLVAVVLAQAGAVAEITVPKKDGRFQAAIETAPYNTSHDFLDKAVLDVQWWSLMGEPVHYYNFKWRRGANYALPSGAKREDIAKYPDLLRRFDAMKPLDIQLEIDFVLSHPANECGASPVINSLYDSVGSLRGTKIVRGTPHLLIGKSGKVQSSLSPGSGSWEEFAASWLGGAEFSGAEVKRAFKCAQKLTLLDMKVAGVTLPETEIASIDAAYLRREQQAQADAEEECDIWSGDDCRDVAEDEAEEQAEQSPEGRPEETTEAGCNIWSGECATSEAKAEEAECDIWAGECATSEAKAKGAECDIWAGECETASISAGECDLWSGDCDAPKESADCDFLAGECDAVIDQRGHEYGVVSKSTGQILIAHDAWTIDSYKHGVAKVSKFVRTLPEVGECGASLYQVGMVGKTGQWLVAPKEVTWEHVSCVNELYLTVID